MRAVHGLAVTVTALALTLAMAACGGGATRPAPAGGTPPAGHEHAGGTVTIAEISASPNDIFPLTPATNQDGYNVNLTEAMWPLMTFSGDGAASIVNPRESLFTSIGYTNGNKTVTIDLKPWQWSDGQPITSRDFTFMYNLLKANYKDWVDYTPGGFPSNVASVATPSAHTVVLTLTTPYSPAYFTDDVLNNVMLLPQHAWDKTSATGKVGNYDETASGAKAVWAFLQKEGSQMSTFATNPLWKVVDGPWTLSSFTASDGAYTYVPNKHYSGPAKPTLSKVVTTPFTTDTAEVDVLRSGTSLDVGTLPLNDLGQASALKAEGYSLAPLPVAGVASIIPNLYSPTTGPLLRQLYIRQAMEDLINRPQIVAKVYGGYADPGNGPVPLKAGGPWVSPLEKAGGPYPYSPSKAIALLKAHGWKVAPGGTSTCQSPGTGAADCGAGISKGQALSFQLIYSSGMTTFDEQNAAIQSSEDQAGVKIALKTEPFDTMTSDIGTCSAGSHPASTCSWQLVDFGYSPYSLYPTGEGLFNTGAISDQGGYSNPELDKLINTITYGSSSQAAFYAYEDYAAEQLPQLWIPNQAYIFVYKSDLRGFAPLNPFTGTQDPEDWYYSS